MVEIHTEQVDGATGGSEHAGTVPELLQAQEKLYHDVLRRADAAKD